MRKNDLRVQKTYKQLVDTFLNLMGEKSFEELTVSEICESAQVHRATFYKHFKDKYEFLNFCFESYLSQIEFNAAEKESPTVENIKESFMYCIVRIFEYIKENHTVFSVICSDKFALSFGSYFTSALNTYCLEKIKQIIPTAEEEKAHIFASFYSGAFIGVAKWYASYGKDCSLDEIYSFLEARVDELCDTYTKKYI